jgi:hypothetical protein
MLLIILYGFLLTIGAFCACAFLGLASGMLFVTFSTIRAMRRTIRAVLRDLGTTARAFLLPMIPITALFIGGVTYPLVAALIVAMALVGLLVYAVRPEWRPAMRKTFIPMVRFLDKLTLVP